MNTPAQPNEIQIIRVYHSPVAKVWEAWTDPKQLAKWWGPRGFSTTTHNINITTHGSWQYTMYGPDGTEYQNKTLYREVIKHSKLVYDHGGNDDKPPLFLVTVNFSESGGKTTMHMTMALPTAEAATQTKEFIKKVGGDTTWDRLAEHLSEKDIFVIQRSFNTPITTMYDCWSQPSHLTKWVPPTGFSMEYINANITPGGSSFYKMWADNLYTMYGKASYRTLTSPDFLKYTQVFCDEHGNISRHPMAPTWPETLLTTVRFYPETSNQTRIALTWEIDGDATQIERDTFHKAKTGMYQGWTGSFDKLEEYLKKLSK